MPFDPLYLILTVPTLLLSLWAQYKVKSTFERFSKVGVRSGMTGAEAAAAILRASGLDGLHIERHEGFLSDHYDPRTRTLRLSPQVHDGRSISSVAVAAHEAGHSLQHAAEYGPLTLRSQLVPVVQIGSQLWFLPFVAGMLLNMSGLIWASVVLFGCVVVFQMVTLPTEFDASKRARAMLASVGIVRTQEEEEGVAKVLNAAALTYVAGLLSSLAQLIYLILRAQERRE
ncbi:MAG: zinc metallopeptidase [Planctomycetes bacterium]|nr:zinc metallopeptidase [Planctomycetota bacterium]